MSSSHLAYVSRDPTPQELIGSRQYFRLDPHFGLQMEGVALATIAEAVGTPCWITGAGIIRTRLTELKAALAAKSLDVSIRYAVKADDHLAILRLMAELGVGADVVSGGELARARAANIPVGEIVFSGVGKTSAEMREAVCHGIDQINVESSEELALLSSVASALGRSINVALRVNPDVDAETHAKISTGRAENKFGIPFADAPALYAEAMRLPGVQPVGLAVHIGSQILSKAPFSAAFRRMAELVRAIRAQGLKVSTIDCGGGLGIAYRDETPLSPAAYAETLRAELGGSGVSLIVEPGRWLVGPAGLLLASVVLVKKGVEKQFVILDAAMNDLARPAIYDAWHGIVPVASSDFQKPLSPADVVGPVCETADTFATGRPLPALSRGSLVAILDTGAYGAVMSSTYNARPLAARILVDNGKFDLIRARQPISALWEREIVPEILLRHALVPDASG